MTRRWLVYSCLVISFSLVGSIHSQEKKPGDASDNQTVTQDAAEVESEPVPSEDEQAVRRSIDSFVEAFNNKNAKAFAAHWSEGGESIAPDGTALQGRDKIETEFELFFSENDNVKIELIDSIIRFLSPNISVENGTAQIVVGDNVGQTQYETIRLRTSDGWKIDSVKETESPVESPSNYDRLKELEWMIGTWVEDQEGDSTLETTCSWTTNQNFMVRSFKVYNEQEVEFEGTHIIGWDPEKQVIRSWLFDSDGGFGAGVWSQEGSRWTEHSRHVMPDGRRASSTNIYDLLEDGAVEYRSIGRQVDGELIQSVGPIRTVRASDN